MMEALATAPVKEGEILAGKYRIERVLGLGGMGVVVAARHVQLDQHVALKFLLPEALENKDVVQRFAREARAAAKIQSEHVARVIDVGTLESGSPYMVMEYLDGKDLSHIIWERGRVPVQEAVDYVIQACEAIAEAHAAGIVHRDLKPANLFLAQRPNGRAIVKVLDFGISKITKGGNAEGEDLSLTKTTTLVGSPLYMSPEQMQSAKHADARSDIWALGVILYELVSGHTPFTAESVTGIVAAILQTQPRPPGELCGDVPPELAAAIMKCLEKDPARRFQTVGELANALWSFVPTRSSVSLDRIARVVAHSQTVVQGTPLATTPQPISFPRVSVPVIGAPSGPTNATNPSWAAPQVAVTRRSAAPPAKRSAMMAGIMLGAFAMLGVLTFAAAIFLRSRGTAETPAAAGAPAEHAAAAPNANANAPANANANANAGASANPPIAIVPASAESSGTVVASTPAPALSMAPAPRAAAKPRPAKASPAQPSAPTTDPKLDIRLTR